MRVLESLDELGKWVGRELAVSDWREITQAQVDAFGAVTGDEQWIHVDVERARRESPFGAPVAHGYLTLSLLPALLQSCLRIEGVKMGVNYGLNRVRFPSPVPVGSRLRARVTLKACEHLAEHAGTAGVQAVWAVTIEREDADKPACVAESVARYYG